MFGLFHIQQVFLLLRDQHHLLSPSDSIPEQQPNWRLLHGFQMDQILVKNKTKQINQ